MRHFTWGGGVCLSFQDHPSSHNNQLQPSQASSALAYLHLDFSDGWGTYRPSLFLCFQGQWWRDARCVTTLICSCLHIQKVDILFTSIWLLSFSRRVQQLVLMGAHSPGVCSQQSLISVLEEFLCPPIPRHETLVSLSDIYSHWSRGTNSLSCFCFILNLKPSNLQVKFLLFYQVIGGIQKGSNHFPVGILSVSHKDSVHVFCMNTGIKLCGRQLIGVTKSLLSHYEECRTHHF